MPTAAEVTVNSDGLKPCPFCGSDASIVKSAVAVVRCESNYCAAESPHFPVDDMDALVRWWNRRPAPSGEVTAGAIVAPRSELLEVTRIDGETATVVCYPHGRIGYEAPARCFVPVAAALAKEESR